MLDVTMQAMQQTLRGLAARQRIIAQNLANIETPGYLAGRVSFEDSLRQAVSQGRPSDMTLSTSVSLDPTRLNGSNVNVDDENVALIETGLRFQLASEAINAKFRGLRTAMRRDA